MYLRLFSVKFYAPISRYLLTALASKRATFIVFTFIDFFRSTIFVFVYRFVVLENQIFPFGQIISPLSFLLKLIARYGLLRYFLSFVSFSNIANFINFSIDGTRHSPSKAYCFALITAMYSSHIAA